MDQLDGFDFVKLLHGKRFYAYNTFSDFIVFWLGSDEAEEVMRNRIEDYGGFTNIEVKSFTRREALRYYLKARKENEKVLRAEVEATNKEESSYPEWSHPLEKWRAQPRF